MWRRPKPFAGEKPSGCGRSIPAAPNACGPSDHGSSPHGNSTSGTSPRAAYFEQAKNGVTVRKALLALLMGAVT